MTLGLDLALLKGACELDVDEFIELIEHDRPMQMQSFIIKAHGWVDPSGIPIAHHRFAILEIEYRGSNPGTYYIRVDRRADRHVGVLGFSGRGGRARPRDTVVLSYDPDRLLVVSRRKELESAMTLGHPLRLDIFGLMLRAIRSEFSDYSLIKENCWAMTSVVLEMLEIEGSGTYIHGRRCLPGWAPELRDRVQNIFKVLCAENTGAPYFNNTYSRPATLPPPPPVQLSGRDEYVKTITQSMCSGIACGRSARLLIGGPGGIGKTSVALRIFYLSELDELIPPERRFFVSCQAVNAVSAFLPVIASCLGVHVTESNPLGSIIRRLRGDGPAMLVLDNAESIWVDDKLRQHARTVLGHLCSIPSMTLLVTMRGTERPDVTKWDPLPPLGPLRLEDAREAFFSVAGATDCGPYLDCLLKKVDCVPLAVNLLARRCQMTGGSPSTLLSQWDTGLLELDRNPEDSVEVSIRLSLDSRPMRQSAEALRLLSLISHFPAGLSHLACAAMAISGHGPSTAEFLLIRLSLAYSPSPGWVTTLEPVRMYIRQWHHPLPNDLCAVEGWHVALASVQGRYEPSDAEFPLAAAILAANHGNISLILRTHIHLKVDLQNIADAVYAFSLHQYWIHPNGDLLDSLLSNCRTQLDVSSSGRCTQLLGDILRLQDRYEESLLKLEEALSRFISVGDERGAAQCVRSIGDVLARQGLYEEAQTILEIAMSKFIDIGDDHGAAHCVKILGNTLFMQRRYKEARIKLKEAQSSLSKLGDRLRAAQCQYTLGNILRIQKMYPEAQSKIEGALSHFVSIGNQRGRACCLQLLGSISMGHGQYDKAESMLEEARTKFLDLGSQQGTAQCLWIIGKLLRMQGQHEKAQSNHEEAKLIWINMGLQEEWEWRDETSCGLN